MFLTIKHINLEAVFKFVLYAHPHIYSLFYSPSRTVQFSHLPLTGDLDMIEQFDLVSQKYSIFKIILPFVIVNKRTLPGLSAMQRN